MSVSVGIDLGTTYSAVAYVPEGENTPKIIMNSEGRKITPSVIQFMNGNLIFGIPRQVLVSFLVLIRIGALILMAVLLLNL